MMIIALLLCVFLLGGTIAWLTSQSELINTFTVGQINAIEPGQLGPDGEVIPVDPAPEDPDHNLDDILNGNLYEPNWKPDSELLPSVKITKDPYVGLGAGSEAAYAYVHVANSMTNNNHVYFAINPGWMMVDAVPIRVNGSTYYTGGLFVHRDKLTTNASENVWTDTALFSEVIVDEQGTAEDFLDTEGNVGNIRVTAYVHQAESSDGTDLCDEAEAAAKAYFANNN